MALSAEQYQAKVQDEVGAGGKNATYIVILPPEATGGTWTLEFSGQTTTPLTRYATPAVVRAALEALPNVDADNVKVSGPLGGPYEVEFAGALEKMPLPKPTADGASLTPDEPEAHIIEVTTKQPGELPYFSDKIAIWWSEFDTITDLNLRYLNVKLQAIKVLKGLTWTQINQEIGDAKHAYKEQYTHLRQMEADTLADIGRAENGSDLAAQAGRLQTFQQRIIKETPDGLGKPSWLGQTRPNWWIP